MFATFQLQKEFERITGEKALLTSLKANLLEMSQKIIQIMEKKDKANVSKLNLELHLILTLDDSKKKGRNKSSVSQSGQWNNPTKSCC